MKHSTKFALVLGLGILALILEFIFHFPLAAQIIITAVGIVISFQCC